ncbi:hypothetical protein [Cellulomonas sp. Marseille-Q8402]
MQDVELVDVADVPSARPARSARVPPGSRPHGRRRRWSAVLAVLALLVGGAVAVGRAASPDAPVSAVTPGMLAPLDGPPWVRWRAPVDRGDDVLAATGVLVVSAIQDRRFGVTAFDEVTGEQLWQRDLGPVAGTRPLTGCPNDGRDVGGVVLCVVEPPVVSGEPWTRDPMPFPAPEERWARVFALAAGTGEIIGSWSRTGRLAAAERLGDDLVLMEVGGDGHARVGRYAGTDGARRWGYRSPGTLRLREGIVSGSELRVNDSFVLVQGWSATVLDAVDGTELSRTPPSVFVVGALSRDVFGTWSSGEGGAVRDRHGELLFASRSLPPAVTASDGDPPDVLVMDEGGSLVGRSVPDGDELWRLDTYRAARLQSGGHLLLLGVDGYQVVDVRTGLTRWESPVRVLMWWAPLTDGQVVVGAGRATSGEPTIEGRRLADGALEWALPLEDGVRSVTAVGGHLVLRSRHELILLE